MCVSKHTRTPNFLSSALGGVSTARGWLSYTDLLGNADEEREKAGSLPFGYAQGRNDKQKGKDKN